jgi:DNA-directed RNA polymerase subunit RPC12/RpoP
MSKWYCRRCGKVFRDANRRWDHDDGASVTVTYTCPYCDSDLVEEMEPCTTCDGGWKMKNDHVCEKCHLRLKSDLMMFARKYSPAALADLDDMLEGNGLEMFT